MKLLLIRHGDPDYAGDTLTEKGWREARLLCGRLLKLDIRALYVSPLGRARDTLKPYLEATGRKVAVMPWMQEFPMHKPDEYTGRSHIIWDYLPAYRERFPDWDSAEGWMDAYPFGQWNVRPLVEEMWQGLDDILARHGYRREGRFYRVTAPNTDTIALVCHFGAATILLSHLLNISSMQLLHATFMAPTAVTTVLTEEQERGIAQWRTIGIGDTSHLYEAGEPLSMSGFFDEAVIPGAAPPAQS